ncbi:DUF4355 domain-containing protein [Clostridium tyrobutyricum]|jgi:hypothetical protein|uniref:DUF4355 domain-containing protein n=1 Tax=Clostridium tyrobutyricum TaxID=1519 RepID=UPI001C3933C7|nr:DUF4355 domain-containing protein [Clostridium tyrobutyricum]MBV4440110.1 DUF4355 domain-containing protein [Clostridium tyrobutyricum]MBV4445316.1 DUF4355 domain-containing protein [Clostridium tyrobutyricum]MBV4445479.1 DUF4355 domain-containing protein [Clostridium tyrobutyricum]
MKKSELTKLIESLGDDAEVDETVSKSDLGKALASSGLTLDAFKEKVEKDADFKSFMDSEKDKHSTKSLETWKTNNLQKEIDAEIKKRYPDKDPKDKALEDLKAKMEKMEAESLKKDLTNKALKTMTEKKLPADLVNFIVGSDEDTTNKNLETLEKIFNQHDESIKTEILKNDTYKPGGQGGAEPTEEAVKGQINSLFGIKE